MPVSRGLLAALALSLIALIGFYATAASRQGGGDDGPAAVQPEPAQPTADSSSADGAEAAGQKPAEGGAKAAEAKAAADGAKAAEAKPAADGAKAARAKPAADRSKAAKRSAGDGSAADVERALADRRTVVLFFYKPGSSDDAATARAVGSLRGTRGVSVITAPIAKLADFRAVVDQLGISQAPATVIVDRSRKARVIEGFVDAKTLRQDVADMR